MPKRRFLGLAVAAPFASVWAQGRPARPRTVGVLAPSTAANEEATLRPFFERMRDLGWVEGQTVRYDRAYANDKHETLPTLAARLVSASPDLIYAPPGAAATAAARATTTIPVVFGVVTDPVAAGLVDSLHRPGRNVTGISSFAAPLVPKRIEILREMLPGARRIGMLHDPTEAGNADLLALRAMAGIAAVEQAARNPAEVGTGVAQLVNAQVQAIMLATNALNFNFRRVIIEAGLKARIPTVGHRSVLVDDGALFSYSASLAEQLRASAVLADKILRGARPAELPVEQPTVFELAVNLRTAGQLGLKVPQTVMVRADKVVE